MVHTDSSTSAGHFASCCAGIGGLVSEGFAARKFEWPVWAPAFCLRAEVAAMQLPHDSYLVDPASSHMLVSKTKPCMSKYKRFYTVKLRMAH